MKKLEQARKARKLNQTDLASRAKLAQSDISAFERGWRIPYPDQAKRLGRLLGLSPDELTQDVVDTPAART